MIHDESIHFALGRLEGKVDTLIQLQRLHEDQLKNHEERLRELEHSRSFTLGMAAAIGAGVSVACTYIIKMITQ
jgi:hypothetical protein